MKRCGDCTYSATSFGSWGCMFHGHTIENTNNSCNDFICIFCECDVCCCGDDDIEE